ncbi:hypothetical protein [Kamptonema formosum]|uniref:hypothetical protein n=1 Tax=Kamptonema formosum TaxID=331992 RepID=UPI00034AB075|nr:hypothetical protein [Kamptonema formosum]
MNGLSLKDIAQNYFSTAKGRNIEFTDAMTNCCKSLFKNLIPAASWGLAALQTLTFKEEEFEQLSERDQQTLRNLPARVFYGVNSDEAITLRLLNVPRQAAQPLAGELGERMLNPGLPLSRLRSELAQVKPTVWTQAIGEAGQDYYKVWKIIEGKE